MRHARIIHPGFPHHIILRGNNRRRLFSYPRDFRAFIRHVGVATAMHAVSLHHICMMHNHVHIIATPDGTGAMSGWVQAFAQRYARYRNRLREGSGKLFEERFRGFPILDDAYLAACTAYVELNPVRARVVRRPSTYLWSSYRALAGDAARSEVPADLLTPSPFYVGLGADPSAQANEFSRWIAEVGAGPEPVLPIDHLEMARAAEELSAGYELRLERPNGTRAS